MDEKPTGMKSSSRKSIEKAVESFHDFVRKEREKEKEKNKAKARSYHSEEHELRRNSNFSMAKCPSYIIEAVANF